MAYSVPATNTLNDTIFAALDQTAKTVQGSDSLGKEVISSPSGRKFRFVVTDASTVASTAGEPAYHMVGGTANEVTSDFSDAQNARQTGSAFAGVFTSVITGAAAEYVWIEVPNGVLVPSAFVAAEVGICDALVAMDDSTFSVAVSFSDNIVAVAMEAATSNRADIILIP